MEIQLPYGREVKVVRVPPGVEIDYPTPRAREPIADLHAAFDLGVASPVGSASLRDIKTDSRVVILVSDLTRSGGAEAVLPLCIGLLRDAGVVPASIRVLVARGTHRKLTKEEREFFRSGPLSGILVEEHDCDDVEKLSALMLTRRGTPVRINSALKNADAIILLAPVSFHYFAGYGGARKLVLPGCADRQAIVANHRLSLADSKPVQLQPYCRPGVLDGNPVHEDMCEVIEALGAIFSVNYFSDLDGNIVFVNSGDATLAHRVACDAYRDMYRCPVEEPLSVMILSAGGYPHDINLLQSHKALRHSAGAMAEGGTILYYAHCEEGVGSESLQKALTTGKQHFVNSAYKDYGLNNQTAISVYDLTDNFEIGMVSAMNVDVLLSAGIKPCVNPESFLAEALEKHNANRVAVVRNGTSLLLHSGEGETP